MNLAPIRYANCMDTNGGPLHRMEASRLMIGDHPCFICNAYLRHSLIPRVNQTKIFSTIDGTGLDHSPVIARYKAISEAMERWAFSSLFSDANYHDQFGFDMDPTTNGMAAFPGLFKRQARGFAFKEAVERFSLVSWWEGQSGIKDLPSSDNTIRYYEIIQPFSSCHSVMCRKDVGGSFTATGFGCSTRLKAAIEQSFFEMERSSILLGHFYNSHPRFTTSDLSTLSDDWERRMVYYSLPEGIRAFEEHCRATTNKPPCSMPGMLIDKPLPGPWSRYATVWRVLFEMPAQRYLDPDELFFFW